MYNLRNYVFSRLHFKPICLVNIYKRSIHNTFTMQDRSDSPDLFESMPSSSETKEKSTHDRQNDNGDWRGIHMNDIYRGKSPWHYYSPPIAPSRHHTVLFEVPVLPGCMPKPHFTSNACHWNNDHVRMPFSHKNLYPVKEGNEDTLKRRWEIIQLSLLRPIANSQELQEAIFSYNSRHSNYDALHYFFNEVLEEEESHHFFNKLLPKIVQLALQLPEFIPCPIPLLKQGRSHSVSLSQLQIASLLANGFLCTFPWRKDMSSYPGLNFNDLFECCGRRSEDSSSTAEKLKCITHYFRRITDKAPTGVVTFERRFVPRGQLPRWDRLENRVADAKLHVSSSGTIEDSGKGLLQVDFANCYLGGGVLGRGCVQEEIRFVTWPELLVSRLFTERLGPTEAVHMIGVECFSKYEGYAESFRWAGDCQDETPRDTSGRRRTTVVAIDAVYYSKPSVQFSPSKMIRELNKAYVGYHKGDRNNEFQYNESSESNNSKIHLPAVATGNWGCGAFRGNVRLKALLQMMACAAVGRDIVYYTFGDSRLRDLLNSMHCFLQRHSVTVSQLWRYLCRFNDAQLPARQIFPFIQQAHLDSTSEIKNSPKKVNTQITDNISNLSQIQTDESQTDRQCNKIDLDEIRIDESEDVSSCTIIESSQPEVDIPKDYISEFRLKKTKLKINKDEIKKNYKDIKSFLYSSDEEDSTITPSSSTGLIQAADSFLEKNNEVKIKNKETNLNLNDNCEKMECDSIEEVQQKSVEIKKVSIKANTPKSEKLPVGKNSKKISDYFKVVTK